MSDAFSSIAVGNYTLANRIFMAPCTRCRADERRAPHALHATYYSQRASAGLIITEAAQVCQEGIGYPGTPGIHTAEQIEGWKLVTDAVHRLGGRIFAQLWHCGRVSHQAYQPGGLAPLSSSAVAKSGEIVLPDFTKAPYSTPREMTVDEIRETIGHYRAAASAAHDAGFDGVELHGANGYLPDQFLRDGVNRRKDEYGGSIPNRARFHLEVTRALCEVLGPARVGVRLSPSGTFNDMWDSSPRATFGYLVTELGRLQLAYLHIMEAMASDAKHGGAGVAGWDPIPAAYFRPMFKGTLVTNGGFTLEKANTYIREGWADAVSFGTAFIANPDLPERFRRGAPLNVPDPSTFYTPGAKGFTDYPSLPEKAS